LKNAQPTTHGSVHAGFSGLRAFVARKKVSSKLIGNSLAIPHDTLPSNVVRQLKKKRHRTKSRGIMFLILETFTIFVTFNKTTLNEIF